jgi:formylglycine-generating enzyme required for sulfatase activity
VLVGGGSLQMGQVEVSGSTQRDVTVGSFSLDAHEVTVARFRRFWESSPPKPSGLIAYPGGSIDWDVIWNAGWELSGASSRTADPTCNYGDTLADRELHPVNCVDWFSALAFCVWDGGRLPTEAEWEFASRGRALPGLSAGRTYPWGNETPDCGRAHYDLCDGGDGPGTEQVGTRASSGDLFDLAGNVSEWTADRYGLYGETCWPDEALTDPLCGHLDVDLRSYRGGSWSRPADELAGAWRGAYPPMVGSDSAIGFRCAR